MKPAVFEFSTPCRAGCPSRGQILWRAAFSEQGLRSLSLAKGRPENKKDVNNKDPRLRALKHKLIARLAGRRVNLKWSAFDLHGRPEFHVRVWKAMHLIPFGQVATYGQVAIAAGSPAAVRACGQACGANPILLFIPCHRVVAAGGLGGFGCGLEWKKFFLALEGHGNGQPKKRNAKI